MTGPRDPFERELARRLRGARRIAVVGIGDEDRRTDRLGMAAARELEALRLPGVRVFLAGGVPESFTGPIRKARPDHVLLVDAADLGRRPGAVELIDPRTIGSGGFSTHALPLAVLAEFLERTVEARVTVVGLQPELGDTTDGLTAAEEAGLTHLVAAIQRILGSQRRSAGRAPA